MVSPVIIAVVALVCCICLAVGIYFATKKEDSPASGSSGTPAAVIDPLQTILQGSQTLQGAEYVATAVKPVTFTPPAEPVAYTMAFSVKIDSQAGGWREIWRRQSQLSPGVNTSRVPAFFISGNDEGNGPGRVHYVHGSTTDWNTHTFSSNFKATPGTWFHFAATVDQATNKITAYVNGVLEPSLTPANATTTGTFKWGPTEFFNIPVNGGVYIKNWYFIPRVLSAADIAKLAAAPSPSSGTTSTYVPEPFGYESESDN
jgi:hypothetical protein